MRAHPSQILYRLRDIRPRGQGSVSYLRKRVVTRAREVVQVIASAVYNTSREGLDC